MATVSGFLHGISGSMDNVTFRHLKDGRTIACKKKQKGLQPESRTRKNMPNKLAMVNVMAMLRLMRDDVQEFFEGSLNKSYARGQYVRSNIRENRIFMTKEMKVHQSCILVKQCISHGTLDPINYHLANDNRVVSDIILTQNITPETRLCDFAKDVLDTNPQFMPSDIITLCLFTQNQPDAHGYHTVSAKIVNIPLDTECQDLFPTNLLCMADGRLALLHTLQNAAVAFVHKRSGSNGTNRASTQWLLCVNPLSEQYSTSEALDAAVESYGGYTDETFLNPGEVAKTPYEPSHDKTHTLTLSSNDDDLGTVSPESGTYTHGDTLTLTALPKTGARFLYWKNSRGDIVSTQTLFPLRILADGTYVAFFGPPLQRSKRQKTIDKT